MAYESRTITKLKFPENLRERFMMYGGDNAESTILFRELVDNCLDLVLRDKLSLNLVASSEDDYKFVYDDGPGMPLYQDKDYTESRSILLDTLMSTHVGSNFVRKYPSLGQNGIGGSLTVACSTDYYCIVNATKQDKEKYPQHIKDGLTGELQFYVVNLHEGILQYHKLMTVDELKVELEHTGISEKLNPLLTKELGTLVVFDPDLKVLKSKTVSYRTYPVELLTKYFPLDKDYKDLTFNLLLNGKKVDKFDFNKFFDNIKFFNDQTFEYSFSYETEELAPVKILGTFAYDKEQMNCSQGGSANLLDTPNGKHINIFSKALGKAISRFNPILNVGDAKYGLRSFTLFIGVKIDFDSQTKVRLVSIADEGFDEKEFIDAFSKYLYDEVIVPNRHFFHGLCQKIIEYKKSLDMLSKKSYIESYVEKGEISGGLVNSLGFRSKVRECSSRDPDKRELYCCEGSSAAGLIISERDPKYQSVMPLRGVILNASEADLKSVVENNELRSIINTLGTSFDQFIDMSKRRYDKVIYAGDADNAGRWITALILGFFAKFLRPWVAEGRVYVLQSPLYVQNGKYIYNDEELDKKKPFTRMKGLGELNPKQARETLFTHRHLIRVSLDDVDEALRLINNEGNARKDLSVELGILVNNDEFSSLVSATSESLSQGLLEGELVTEESND